MPNMLASGMEWLNEQLKAAGSSTVTYARGAASTTFPATIGRHKPYDAGEQGNSLYGFEMRVTFERTALVLSGALTTPQRGDRITVVAGGLTSVYDVLPIEGERWWRDSDAFGKRIEVLVKLQSRTAA